MAPLTAWENFYVIVGSSAGALTGLTFVAITLGAQARQRELDRGIAAFTTPTVVHFGAVLFVCALLSAPWPTLTPVTFLLGFCGLAGVLYTAIVMRRQLRMETYVLVLEDWLSYGICPFVAYAVLLVMAILLPVNLVSALFAIGGVLLLLLFLGIHNAWDIVTYIVIERIIPQDTPKEQDERDERDDRNDRGDRRE